jgi:hypothetical protein
MGGHLRSVVRLVEVVAPYSHAGADRMTETVRNPEVIQEGRSSEEGADPSAEEARQEGESPDEPEHGH